MVIFYYVLLCVVNFYAVEWNFRSLFISVVYFCVWFHNRYFYSLWFIYVIIIRTVKMKVIKFWLRAFRFIMEKYSCKWWNNRFNRTMKCSNGVSFQEIPNNNELPIKIPSHQSYSLSFMMWQKFSFFSPVESNLMNGKLVVGLSISCRQISLHAKLGARFYGFKVVSNSKHKAERKEASTLACENIIINALEWEKKNYL